MRSSTDFALLTSTITHRMQQNNKRIFPFWFFWTKASPLSRFNDWPFPVVSAIKASTLVKKTKKNPRDANALRRGDYLNYITK